MLGGREAVTKTMVREGRGEVTSTAEKNGNTVHLATKDTINGVVLSPK